MTTILSLTFENSTYIQDPLIGVLMKLKLSIAMEQIKSPAPDCKVTALPAEFSNKIDETGSRLMMKELYLPPGSTVIKSEKYIIRLFHRSEKRR